MVNFASGSVNKGTYWEYTESFALFTSLNRDKMYLAPLLSSGPPVYSWKYRSSGILEPISKLKITTGDGVNCLPLIACAGRYQPYSRPK